MSLPKSVTSNEQAKLIYPKYTLYGHSFSSVAFATLEILEPFESFPGGSVAKNPPANAGDIGSFLELHSQCHTCPSPLVTLGESWIDFSTWIQ